MEYHEVQINTVLSVREKIKALIIVTFLQVSFKLGFEDDKNLSRKNKRKKNIPDISSEREALD